MEITSRASLTEIDLEVSQNGGLIKAIRRPLAGERKIMERFRLAPGDYLLSVAGRGEHDVYEDSQTLRVPASSVVQVSLGAGASP